MARWTLEPGRTLTRDGVKVARLDRYQIPEAEHPDHATGAHALRPAEADALAAEIVAALNAADAAKHSDEIAPGEFTRAKLAGYDVEPDGFGSGYIARDFEGVEIEHKATERSWPSERAAWEACDRHRMFGEDEPDPAPGYLALSTHPDSHVRHCLGLMKGRDPLEVFTEAAKALHSAGWRSGSRQAREAWDTMSAALVVANGNPLGFRGPMNPEGPEVCDMTEVETRNTCVLSMARLTEETAKWVFNTPVQELPVMATPMGPSMIMLYAHQNRPDGCPDDLWAIMEWARRPQFFVGEQNGCFDYVILDADKDALEDGCDLPIYGYEVPGAVPSPEAILRGLIARAHRYYHTHITKPEACPTGENFNVLFEMIEEAEVALNAL